MPVHGEGGIYRAVEKALRASPDPLTCHDLWEQPSVRQYAKHVNKISDTLGNMWRRGYLTRVPAPKEMGSQAKWAYAWDQKRITHPPPDNGVKKPTAKSTKLLSKPLIEIDENTETVTIELDQIIVYIKPKR